MISGRSSYIFRRISGLVFYVLAYSALWPGLTYPVVTIQGNPTFWSNSKLNIGTGDRFLEPMSRSTIDLIMELFESRFYFPCGVIFLFSVVSPAIKLLVIFYGEIVGNIFRIRVDDMSKMVDLRKGLRVIAKYQCVDVFVAIITRQLLNSDFVTCRMEDGFYYFSFYSLLSIFAAQVSDTVPPIALSHPLPSLPPVHRTKPPVVSTSTSTTLDMFLLFSSVSMFVVGLTWSLGLPILSVKFLFQSKIVIGESIASLASFLTYSSSSPDAVFSSSLVLVTCVVTPTVVVLLSGLVQVFDAKRTRRSFYIVSRITAYIADWSLIDVFAVALLTSLFSFASFTLLRAVAPWGFYAVLMAAMSAFEVGKAVQVSLLDQSRANGYSRLDLQQEMDEMANEFSLNSSSDDEAQHDDHYHHENNKTVVMKPGGILYVIVTVFRKLGLPFFFLKALGWAVFFLVWYMNSGSGSLDVNSLSATLRSNIPLVSSALKTSIPYGVGMCKNLNFEFPPPTTSTFSSNKCIDKSFLYYEKNTAYEVLARWLKGFDKLKIVDMYVSVPASGKFALTVRGQFEEIQLSLFIGQCLSNIFSSSAKFDPKIGEPVCSKIFDKIHSWSGLVWSVEVSADCYAKSPFVREIEIDEVFLDSEMKIEEEIAFGIKIPVDDLSFHFKQGIKDSIQPLLSQNEPWIPWGPSHYDLQTLLSKLVELNVDGANDFSCPTKDL